MTSIEYILMDVEGTTSSIDFVRQVLFPYAAKHLENYVLKHQGEEKVVEQLGAVQKTLDEEQTGLSGLAEQIQALLKWIKEDRKHTALKAIQGMIWKSGFESGAYQAHVYPEVAAHILSWKEKGYQLGIYSSGSIQAQKLFFGYTEAGNLLPALGEHFDTTSGHKRETSAYQNISQALKRTPETILFLSDVPEELYAAKEAGYQVCQLVRPGTEAAADLPTEPDFAAVERRFSL